jgi:cytochrome oxidase Cu insertion factor (SCO1/SenC/PrrC family)
MTRARHIGIRYRRRLALLPVVVAALVLVAGCATGRTAATSRPVSGLSSGQARAAGANPVLDPGTALGGAPAPDFRLVNQFGQHMALSQFRGKVVILAFTDSECTTICPLTTESMVQARELLGRAGGQVQLLGVDANPDSTAVSDVLAYSRAHEMVNQWDFLTGTPAQLRAVWKAYHILVQIEAGQIDHTPAVFLIDTRGRERVSYLTQMSYASVSQAGQVMADAAASLLPGHPRPARQLSLAYINGLSPASRVTLPAVTPGSVTLGAGHPHLLVFFATWLTETSDLRAGLRGLSRYARDARRGGLPPLVAVDETVAEPSAATISRYLAHLGPLGYPVTLDLTGRLADGYYVQDQPWFALTSAAGKIVWHHAGWLPLSQLEAAARTH